mgnify:FL=1
MIKIFDANDRDFSSAGNIIIKPLKCKEYKKKSLNGWYIEVEIPIAYKKYIKKDKLCVVKTKTKLKPQAFRIAPDTITYTNTKISFTANHVMFDAKDYFLVDVRPTKLNGISALNYINERADDISPFNFFSNIENISTAYFIRKNMLEAWKTIEERWNGVFDADNWDISFVSSIGHDNGLSIIYGKDLQGIEVYEDWTNVVTKLYPVGYDGLMLPEVFLEADIKYDKPYTKTIDFETILDSDEQTEENLIKELRENAQKYLNENKYPKISYNVKSDIKQELEIGDTIHVMHPIADILTEVLEYEYDIILQKVRSVVFGNYSRDVKSKFDNVKNTITQINQVLSKQQSVINKQTNMINTLNKNGYVYIDENEIMILDKLPKEKAQNVWRFGIAGIGFSSNGIEGPFETAITMDGQINAKFITTGTMSVDRIEGLANKITEYEKNIVSINLQYGSITQKVESQATLINNNYQDVIDKLNGCAQKSDVETIRKSVETTQTDSKYAIEIAKEIQQNGVTKVKTSTGYTFDDDGLSVEKTGAKTKAKLNEAGLNVKDATGSNEESLLFAGYDEETGETIVKSKNMTVEKYLVVGKYSRIEDFVNDGVQGTGVFWIGG